jgi:hypothetical protein
MKRVRLSKQEAAEILSTIVVEEEVSQNAKVFAE